MFSNLAMSEPLACAKSIGEISRETGYAVHRIEYVIRSRNIQPACKFGNSRVFGTAAVEHIVSELRRIDRDMGREIG